MQGMTKREQQVTDEKQIQEILAQGKVLHLGLSVNDEPYVVPMNYGHVFEGEKLVLYLHSALQGKKLDMLRTNPKVFFDITCNLLPFEGVKPCQYGLSYSSLMGKGVACVVEDPQEKLVAMKALMKTQTGKDFEFEPRWLDIVAVVRIDVAEFTAKHRPLPEKMR
jgi:nitroimidazol reductase NimA-like FMN-containing flavoprotein (pyridoxamine 5'-phosphate oxidase superfamily)